MFEIIPNIIGLLHIHIKNEHQTKQNVSNINTLYPESSLARIAYLTDFRGAISETQDVGKLPIFTDYKFFISPVNKILIFMS